MSPIATTMVSALERSNNSPVLATLVSAVIDVTKLKEQFVTSLIATTKDSVWELRNNSLVSATWDTQENVAKLVSSTK